MAVAINAHTASCSKREADTIVRGREEGKKLTHDAKREMTREEERARGSKCQQQVEGDVIACTRTSGLAGGPRVRVLCLLRAHVRERVVLLWVNPTGCEAKGSEGGRRGGERDLSLGLRAQIFSPLDLSCVVV
jgi:hypothetical protein